MYLLAVTTVIDLTTELFLQGHIVLFLSTIYWPYFVGLFWPRLIYTTIAGDESHAAFLCSLNEHNPCAPFREEINRPFKFGRQKLLGYSK